MINFTRLTITFGNVVIVFASFGEFPTPARRSQATWRALQSGRPPNQPSKAKAPTPISSESDK
jgi:hypothetical protein